MKDINREIAKELTRFSKRIYKISKKYNKSFIDIMTNASNILSESLIETILAE